MIRKISSDTSELKEAFVRCTCLPDDVNKLKLETTNLKTKQQTDADLLNKIPPVKQYLFRKIGDQYIVYTTFPTHFSLDYDRSIEKNVLFDKFIQTDKCIPVFFDVIEALTTTLSVMKKNNFTHTDIKPANLVVGFDEAQTAYKGVKVIDFGGDFEGPWDLNTYIVTPTYTYLNETTYGNFKYFALNSSGVIVNDKYVTQQIRKKFSFNDPIRIAMFQTFLTLVELTSMNNMHHFSLNKKAFKPLFQYQMENDVKFRCLTDLCMMVFAKWCFIDDLTNFGPDAFVETATSILDSLLERHRSQIGRFAKLKYKTISSINESPFFKLLLGKVAKLTPKMDAEWNNHFSEDDFVRFVNGKRKQKGGSGGDGALLLKALLQSFSGDGNIMQTELNVALNLIHIGFKDAMAQIRKSQTMNRWRGGDGTKKPLSEYNKFVSAHLRPGTNMKQVAELWHAKKRAS